MKDLIEIIKQKGIGEHLGLCETNLDVIENYPQYVQISLAPENKKYFVELLTHELFTYPERVLYEGYNEKRAERRFNQAVEEGRSKIKQKSVAEKPGIN